MLSKDFSEFIESLNSNDVQYLVIGGYAVAYHGHPRYTKDIDLWIRNDVENVSKLLRALDHFGFSSLDLKESDFCESDSVVQLGYPPNRIDLITGIEGIDFDELYRGRETVALDGVEVTFIGKAGLIQSKTKAGRLQDIADIEGADR